MSEIKSLTFKAGKETLVPDCGIPGEPQFPVVVAKGAKLNLVMDTFPKWVLPCAVKTVRKRMHELGLREVKPK